MIIGQISDLHIKAGRRKAYGIVDAAAMLEACVAQLVTLNPAPAAFVMTGDLVDQGTDEDYALLRELLAPLIANHARTPIYLIPGNHDEREALRRGFPDFAYLRDSSEFIQYTARVGPLRLVAVDTVVPGEGGGALCDARLAWIDQTLAADRTPTVVLMHHPPFPTGIAHMELVKLQGRERFAAVIKKHPHVERVLCGHLHRSIQARIGTTFASTCPSPAHQVALDLTPDGLDCFVMEPPGYQLHYWTGNELVTHTAVLGAYAGPFRFRENGKLID
jgi:3',5'-cyclic-AMP phosphodiesterase